MNKENLKYSFLLVLSIVVSYFEIAFKMFSTKWDNLSAFFPYRYTASHWWSNGHLPLWDPYQNLGYPMHANPQGGVWYPIAQLFGWGGYTLTSLNMELLFHIVLAGLGMFFFTRNIGLKAKVGFVAGLAYALSGFVLGSSNMIGFTAGACWLPWVLLFLRKCLQEFKISHCIGLALALYLQITGAYVAFTIVLVYVMIAYTVIYILRSYSIGKTTKRAVLIAIIGLPLVVLYTAPFLYSIWDSLPYISRAEAVVYDMAQYGGNFSPLCLFSLIAPYINMSTTGFPQVDVSLSSVYIGIPLLLFFFIYVFKHSSKSKWIWIGAIVGFYLLALGLHTPVHAWAHGNLPGINMFRHPYLFTLYAVFLMIVTASIQLNQMYTSGRLKAVKLSYLIFAGTAAVALLGLWFYSDFSAWPAYREHLRLLTETSPLNAATHAFIQTVVSTLLVLAGLFLLIRGHFLKYLPLLVVLDLFIALQLNAPKNLYYNTKMGELEKYMEQHANSALTNQAAHDALNQFRNNKLASATGFWVNLNTYDRTTGVEGYNPFIFSRYIELMESEHFEEVTKHGLVFATEGYSYYPKLGYDVMLHPVVRDTMVHNLKLEFNGFRCSVASTSDSVRLFLNQNYHHNWYATVDRYPVSIERSNMSLMSIPLTKGIHEVAFKYRDERLERYHRYSKIGWMVSIVVLMLLGIKRILRGYSR